MSNVIGCKLDPYLFFSGNARQALEYYKSIFGGRVDISTHGSLPQDTVPEEYRMDPDSVMHGLLDGDVRLMASDTKNASPEAKKIELSLSGEDEAKLRGYFEALAKDGKITVPLAKAPWGDTFGMVTDKFNIAWMVDIVPKEAK